MTRKEAIRINHQEDKLVSLGISRPDAEALRRISMTLHRWAERECNGEIQRDEGTGKPFVYSTYDGRKLYATADKETGALKRLGDILAKTPGLSYYHQSDPRGAALYILRPGDVPEGKEADSYYSRGIVVY